MNNTGSAEEFRGLRKYFWPIHNYELKKFLPMACMIAAIIFVYGILRSTKDTMVVSDMGAEVISSLKLGGVLPSALLFMVLYSKLANHFSNQTIFYILTSFFVTFVICFRLFLQPNLEFINIDLTNAIHHYPRFKYMLLAISHWSYSLFYIMAELWGSVMLSFLFWQFANQFVTIPEAKRFYPLFGVIGQFGMVLSGKTVTLAGKYANNDWVAILDMIVYATIIAGITISILYWYLNKFILTNKRFYNSENNPYKQLKRKIKLSVKESFKYIFSSKYLGLIALLVLCYGTSINLAEGVWKSQLRLQYTNKVDYSNFMGNFQCYGGLANMTLMLLSSSFLRIFSWRTCAMLTPAMIFVTGILFFCFIVFNTTLEPLFAGLGVTTLVLTVWVGSIQNVLSKGVKYSLFDSTKEMSYIPLDDDLKSKGKAAVDITGGRMGKSGGAAIQALLLVTVGGSLLDLIGEIFVIFTVIMMIWFWAVSALYVKFKNLTEGKHNI